MKLKLVGLFVGIGLIIWILTVGMTSTGFKGEQQKFQRVRTAFKENESWLKELYATHHIDGDFDLYLRAFKQGDLIEVWVRPSGVGKYSKLVDFEVCARSGDVGPKRKQGDLQVPEGFYHIDRFNPVSNFYLSLGINYPNKSDKIWSSGMNAGGDIFIHGSCVTVGCLPIQDVSIKRLYALCVDAKNRGQRTIPVSVFPRKFKSGESIPDVPNERYSGLWRDLAKGQLIFDRTKALPTIGFNADGTYSVSE